MAAASRTRRSALMGLNGILLAFPIALFSGALITDITYLRSAEIQWTNFSAWLIVGGLVFGGLVLALAFLDLLLGWGRPGRGRALAYALLLAAMWILGLINAFKHSQDAWSSVGATGLVLSILSAVLALVAGWLAYSRTDLREAGQ